MRKSIVARKPLIAVAVAFAVASIVLGSRAASALPSCTAAIRSCGCIIGQAGLYAVTRDLAGSPNSDCIQIKTASAVLNLQGHSITGPGAAGIHVLRGSANLMLEGHGASISGFNVGMQIEGSKVVGEHFDLSNNVSEGLTILKVKQVLLADIIANLNGASGVRITSGGTNGVSELTANSNGGSGVLIQGSSTNLIGPFTANGNSADGVLITCAPKKKGPGCGAVSGGNLVYDGAANNNTGSGIEIGPGSKKANFVGDNSAQNNTSGTDLLDDNPGCGGALVGNAWFTNTGAGSPSCVQ